MVIKGKSRGNGSQLANYLTGTRDNDRTEVFEIRGTATPQDLKKSLLEMSLTAELTKGSKGLYHAQLNPRDHEANAMSREDVTAAADTLEKELGLVGQKRAIVLHEKKGRIHYHIVWERYDHEKGILRSDSQNFKAHDRARAALEQQFNHERTAEKRNRSREPEHKATLTSLWQTAKDGWAFVKAAAEKGYTVAKGLDRRPYKVITPEGKSLDLVRQLEGVRTAAVKDRLISVAAQLPTEAQALEQASRQRQDALQKTEIVVQETKEQKAQSFRFNYIAATSQDQQPVYNYQMRIFRQQAGEATEKANEPSVNRDDKQAIYSQKMQSFRKQGEEAGEKKTISPAPVSSGLPVQEPEQCQEEILRRNAQMREFKNRSENMATQKQVTTPSSAQKPTEPDPESRITLKTGEVVPYRVLRAQQRLAAHNVMGGETNYNLLRSADYRQFIEMVADEKQARLKGLKFDHEKYEHDRIERLWKERTASAQRRRSRGRGRSMFD